MFVALHMLQQQQSLNGSMRRCLWRGVSQALFALFCTVPGG
jgi:hypothetical protein